MQVRKEKVAPDVFYKHVAILGLQSAPRDRGGYFCGEHVASMEQNQRVGYEIRSGL